MPRCCHGSCKDERGRTLDKLVIFNADDVGMGDDVDRGVVRAARAGTVKEASVCVSERPKREVLDELRSLGVGLGLHFCLTEGNALYGPQPGLTDASGRFLGLPRVLLASLSHRLPEQAVQRELEAQLEALERLGAEPTHINGHHHVHAFPVVAEVVLREVRRRECVHLRVPLEPAPLLHGGPRGVLLRALGRRLAKRAARAGVPVRAVAGLELTGRSDYVERALDLVATLRDPVVEWVVHPREGDTAHTWATVGARHAGPEEVRAMESAELRERLTAQGYRVASYSDVFAAASSVSG